MSTEPVVDDAERKKNRYHFDRHTPEYREQFADVTAEMLDKCPVAWSDTYGGHWVAAGHPEVFELARSADYLSNDHDPQHERRGYKGISIPSPEVAFRGGFLEMDPPEQRYYRQLLNPYLSPAAVARWTPLVDEIVRASLNEKIETGQIDFVDDLANIVPAVLTLGMLGMPLKNWDVYVEPIHASVYTPPNSPDMPRLQASRIAMRDDMMGQLADIRANRRPGLIDALAHGGDQRHRAAGLRAARDNLAAHRGRVRHHHRADRARPRVAVGAPGPAGAAVGRAGHAAQPGHRGVPALLHPGPRRRAHHLRRLRDRRPAVQGGRADLAVVGDVQPRPRSLPQPQRG